jgi:uroporphyrinogen-III synthase
MSAAKLDGLRIVITRAAHQAADLAQAFRETGADPIFLPVVAIGPPADPQLLKQAAARAGAGHYDWIVFASANGVSALAAYVPNPQSVLARIAVVGEATRRTAEAAGFHVDLVPDEFTAECLVAAFGDDLNGASILIPSASGARDVLPRGLASRGARVDIVEAYCNVLPQDAKNRANEIFREPLPDWVTFASPSAVLHLAQVLELDKLRRVKIASIGPVTSSAIRLLGLHISAEAQIHSAHGLVAAIQTANDRSL